MTRKRFTLIFTLLALLTAAVSAHDDTGAAETRPGKHHGFGLPLYNELLQDATGLEAQALRAALAEGSTVAELIKANEGDLESVIAEMAAQLAEDINERAASFLDGLDDRASEELHAVHGRRGPWGRRFIRLPRVFMIAAVSDTITQATGLDAPELRASLRDGSTLAELIAANGGDVSAVAAEIVTTITDEVNATAAERIEGLEENLGELFNSDLSEHWRRGRRGRMRPRFFFGYWRVHGQPPLEEPAA